MLQSLKSVWQPLVRRLTPRAAAMAGVGDFYYEIHAGRRGHAAADEAMLRAVTFIKKLQERAHFSQDEHGTRILLERVTQNQHAMDCAVGRLRNEGWGIRVRAILAEETSCYVYGCLQQYGV